jgi:hypothetical protein
MKRKTWKYILTLLFVMVIGFLILFGYSTYTADRYFGYHSVYYTMLGNYIRDHDGNMPSSLKELIDLGYCQQTEDGKLKLPTRNYTNDHPEWFDVAWGVKKNEISEDGKVTISNRLIVRPTANSKCRLFLYHLTSQLVAREMLAFIEQEE